MDKTQRPAVMTGSSGRKALSGERLEDIDLATLLGVLWSRRYFILLGTFAAVAAGVAYALMSPPVYFSQATIALKDGEKGGGTASMLSQLGGLGGAVASQLGIGSTSLAKLEVVLNGRDLADSVIRQLDLLPSLFPDRWDAKGGAWKDSSEAPTIREGVEALRKGALEVAVDEKRKLIRVGVNARDPLAAKRMVDGYLSALNRKILGDARSDAALNRAYLEDQIAKTSDPVLQEKISTMIASEIEKHMLVSSRSFEILEAAVVPLERAKPKRKLIVALSFVIGFMFSVASVLALKYLRPSGSWRPETSGETLEEINVR